MGGTGAISTSTVFIISVTFAFFDTTSALSIEKQKTISQSSRGDQTRVKRFSDRDQSVWISSENQNRDPFADFDKDVRRRQEEFDRRWEQMNRGHDEVRREHDRRWNSNMEDFDRRNSLISSIVIPLSLLGFVVPCIILICCCVPSCPLSRRRERGGLVHGGRSNGNRFGFGGVAPGSLGGANITTTTYPSQHQTTTYPPQHQTTTYPPQHQGTTNIPLLPPQPSPVPHQAYSDTKGPQLPPPYHAAMESTTSSSNPDPSAPKILPYANQPAFNPHAM